MIYNGIDIRDVDGCISVAKEIPPGAPPRSVKTMDGMGGSVYTGLSIDPAEYLVRVNIAAKTRDDAWRTRNKLAAWACLDHLASLIPTHWPCVSYDAICQSISAPEFSFGFCVVTVSFLIPRPYAMSLSESKEVLPGGGAYHFGGNIPARPIIAQTVAKTADSLSLKMDGDIFFRLIGTFNVGATVSINFADQAIMYNGIHAEAMADYTVSRWSPGFGPGSRMILSSDSGPLAVSWRDEWM